MNFSDGEKLKALERDLALRKSVYARRVQEGKMSVGKADREIAIMQANSGEFLRRRERAGYA
jgi:hypothetical protein